MTMRSRGSRKLWGLFLLGIALQFLVSENSFAEAFRRRQVFGRQANPLQFGFNFNRQGFNQFNAAAFGRGQGFGFNIPNNRFNNVFDRNQDLKDVKDVIGFSQLQQAGNNLIERTSQGIIRKLQILGNGELAAFDPRVGTFVRPEAETVRHLREFYLKNLDKFNGAQANAVNRFLVANGGISNGRMVVDLDAFDLESNSPGFNQLPLEERRKAALAALNFLLNTLQTRFKLQIPPAKVEIGRASCRERVSSPV